MDARAKELVTIGDRLFTKKRQWDELGQEICEHFHPLRADYTSPFTLGTDFSTDLMESFPVQARATLSNTISALLRQGDWFAPVAGATLPRSSAMRLRRRTFIRSCSPSRA